MNRGEFYRLPNPRSWVPRTITVVCDAGSHAEVEVCQLVSKRRAVQEQWIPTGERQTLVHSEDYDGTNEIALRMLGRVAERYKIVCVECGDDITLGDMLGTGWTTMLTHRANDEIDIDFTPHNNLSRVADSGVSRLSMTGLRRTLQMP
jgi:hypothetical protein